MALKSPLIILFFIILLAIIVYTILFVSGGRVDLHYPSESKPSCQEGQTRNCQVANCSGLSSCKGGIWSSCRLDMVCEPGSRISCSEQGCVYGFKECDECGTGYGPCK